MPPAASPTVSRAQIRLHAGNGWRSGSDHIEWLLSRSRYGHLAPSSAEELTQPGRQSARRKCTRWPSAGKLRGRTGGSARRREVPFRNNTRSAAYLLGTWWRTIGTDEFSRTIPPGSAGAPVIVARPVREICGKLAPVRVRSSMVPIRQNQNAALFGSSPARWGRSETTTARNAARRSARSTT